jgi:hypothetical protein
MEGSLSSLSKILEDVGHDLRADPYGQEALNELVRVLPSLFSSESPKVRGSAVQTMNLMVPLKPAQLSVSMDAFVQVRKAQPACKARHVCASVGLLS